MNSSLVAAESVGNTQYSNTQHSGQPTSQPLSQDSYNAQDVERFLESLDHGSVGGVTEIRILPKEPFLVLNGQRTYVGKTVVGYYESHQYAKAAQDIAPFDGKASIYVLFNPCHPDLLARAGNRLQPNAQYAAKDADIIRLQWGFLDFDSVRPSGISASEEELQKALSCRDDIADYLEGHGAQVIKAMSGNGGHLLVRLPDYPNDEEHRILVKKVTEHIAAQFSDERVTVDTAVCNPSRGCKVYGTLAIKGDNLSSRPHRRATIALLSTPLTPFDLKQLPWEVANPMASYEPPLIHLNGATDRERTYCLTAIKSEADKLRSTPDGQKHPQLVRSAARLGGLLHTGTITEQEIEAELFDAVKDRAADPQKARRTIREGIRYGRIHPRQISDAKFENATPNSLINRKNPRPEGSSGLLGSYPEAFENFQADPLPPTPNLRPVPTLPQQLLPDALRDWLVDIAERMNCPLEYAAGPAIVALSSLVGRKVGIRPKRFDDWTTVPNLWGMSVGAPSARKTPAATAALKLLGRLEAEAIEAHRKELEQFSIQKEVATVKAKAAKSALEKAAKKKDVTDKELDSLAQDIEKAGQEPPVLRRYKLTDATVEAVGERLKEHPNGLLLHRDELTGLLGTMKKQGHENDRAFYLEAWAGTQENYHYDRVGRGRVTIPSPCISITGTIQPGPLSRVVSGAVDGQEADGFLPRFQIPFYPDPVKYQHVDRRPNIQAEDRAFEVFRALGQLDAESVGAAFEVGNNIPSLHFSEDAQPFFDEWLRTLECEKLPAAQGTPLIESHLAKHRSLMPSLALLFHLIDVVDEANSVGSATRGAVSLQAAQMAAQWCDVLEEHARRIYQLAYEGSLHSALALAERIKDGSIHNLRQSDGTRFKTGDVVQRGWSSLSTTEDVNRAVTFLEERHWLQFMESPPLAQGGRPEQWIYVHPNLLQEKDAGDNV
jgi:putative DNA primase/helicase